MITVDVTAAEGLRTLPKAEFRKVVQHVCRRHKVTAAEFSFVIVDDRTIRSINKKFLKHDVVTDIITFPLENDRIAAEIYICAPQMRRQAKEQQVTVTNEMTRLIVHGILHTLGYDDTTSAKKKEMDAIQERYVAQLSLKK
jgi:rRNA maturation RNase YbeY